jgi:hypothetical protein
VPRPSKFLQSDPKSAAARHRLGIIFLFDFFSIFFQFFFNLKKNYFQIFIRSVFVVLCFQTILYCSLRFSVNKGSKLHKQQPCLDLIDTKLALEIVKCPSALALD